MSCSKTLTGTLVALFLTQALLIAGQPAQLKTKILHPQHGMFFYVSPIEVSGDIPEGFTLTVDGHPASTDSTGRFKTMRTLQPGHNWIHLLETYKGITRSDSLMVILRRPDHLQSDSVFINQNIPDSLDLGFTYPQSGRTRLERVSIRGVTHPEALLTINDDSVTVFPSGAFTQYVNLLPGKNVFIAKASLNQDSATDTLTLEKTQPRPPQSELDARSIRPRGETWVMENDRLPIVVSAPPGEKIAYKIPGITGWIEMREARPGTYSAVHYFRNIESELESTLSFRRGIFGKRVKGPSIRVLTDAKGGLTIDEDTRVYDTADTDQLLFPLQDSVAVQIIGKSDRMYRIALGAHRSGYVLAENVILDPQQKLDFPVYVGSLSSEMDADWSILSLRTGAHRLPFSLKEKANPARLELQIYGAKQGWEWTQYPDSGNALAIIERSQPFDDVWQMDFYPASAFWGWYGRYEDERLVIGIREAPLIPRSNPFENIRIEIDPGHGGWERGARGITGYAEADANLRYSLKLEKLLRDAGATVFLTRRDDRRLSLPERAEIARKDSVHIFIMAHNNAPGASRDILEAKGSSTFYTWPSSKGLSDHIYPYLGHMGIDTAGKISRYYYYLTRQTDFLVYLIEGAFMTYPQEEMFLMSEEGLDRLAEAAFLGLVDFLAENVNEDQATAE